MVLASIFSVLAHISNISKSLTLTPSATKTMPAETMSAASTDNVLMQNVKSQIPQPDPTGLDKPPGPLPSGLPGDRTTNPFNVSGGIAPTMPVAAKPVATKAVETTVLKELPSNWEDVVLAKFKEVRAFYGRYAGLVGCNPYFYLCKTLFPLESLFNNRAGTFEWTKTVGDTVEVITKDQWNQILYNKVMGIEMKEEYAMHDPKRFSQEQQRREDYIHDLKTGRNRQTIIQ